MHGWGAETYNWDCGRGFYDTSGCDGESEYAVNNMPDSVEMIYRSVRLIVTKPELCCSDIGDEIYTGGRLTDCAGDDNPCRAAMQVRLSQTGVCVTIPVLVRRTSRAGVAVGVPGTES